MMKKPDKCCAPGSHKCCTPLSLGDRVVGIDLCIAHIVAALNAGGIKTLTSCCGHGAQPGHIVMEGEHVIVLENFENWASQQVTLVAYPPLKTPESQNSRSVVDLDQSINSFESPFEMRNIPSYRKSSLSSSVPKLRPYIESVSVGKKSDGSLKGCVFLFQGTYIDYKEGFLESMKREIEQLDGSVARTFDESVTAVISTSPEERSLWKDWARSSRIPVVSAEDLEIFLETKKQIVKLP